MGLYAARERYAQNQFMRGWTLPTKRISILQNFQKHFHEMASRKVWWTCLPKLLSNRLEREEQNFERCDSMRGWKLESHPVGVPVTSKLVYTCPCRQANLPGWCIGWRKGVRSSMRDELRTSTCTPRKLVSSLFLPFFFFSPCRVPFPSSNNSTFIRWRVLSAVKLRHVEIMVITGWAQKA